MDILRTYLDNIFATLPNEPRLAAAKAEMLANMEDRCRELLAQGRNENEAAGLVIAEFGNIHELIDALGLEAEAAPAPLRSVGVEEAQRFAEDTRQASFLVAGGVALCILGAALLILFIGLGEGGWLFPGRPEEFPVYTGLIALFLCVVPAVAMFVKSGFLTEPHEYLEEECFILTPEAQSEALALRERYRAYSRNAVTFGVALCVLSPLAIFVTALASGEEGPVILSVSLLLALVATGVYLLIRGGMTADIYKQLLQVEEYSCGAKQAQADSLVQTVTAVAWPLATAAFLLCGFIWDLWHPAWVVFPITGVLLGAFTAIAKAVRQPGRQP